MAAGTVISGGFPGRVAQEVQPNPKCHGCLHFDGQAGRTGACTIGLRPWLCGDGQAAEIGYAPITHGAGTYLPDMSNHGAHAREVETQFVSDLYGAGSTKPVEVKQVTLGEEHVHFVKSLVAKHTAMQKSMCRLCQSGIMIGTAPANVGPQVCTCEPIAAVDVAKSLVRRLNNRERVAYDLDDLTAFVYDVAKAGFKMPKPRTKTEAKKSVDGGDLQKGFIADDDMFKSYQDDWLCQFKGTPLFALAHKLCEQELAMREAQIDRQEKRAKHNKERDKALAKLRGPEDHDWQAEDAIRQRLDIAKQKLSLKLAEHQQKAIGNVSKALSWKTLHTGQPRAETPHGTYRLQTREAEGKHVLSYAPKASKDHFKTISVHDSHKEARQAANAHHAVNGKGPEVSKAFKVHGPYSAVQNVYPTEKRARSAAKKLDMHNHPSGVPHKVMPATPHEIAAHALATGKSVG